MLYQLSYSGPLTAVFIPRNGKKVNIREACSRLSILSLPVRGLLSLDNDPLSSDNEPLSSDNGPLSVDNEPLSLDNDPLSVDNEPLSVDNSPLSQGNTQERWIFENTVLFFAKNTPIITTKISLPASSGGAVF
ncbi:MAG: hypothetical protein LBJ24_08890 [Treponema sp.]|nr:hypothetical protein [Treponema sp.]